jgi:uncharacterized protein YebE (UPF0316 family)
MQDLFSQETITYIIIPILIFFARLTDVTIGTMRLIFVSKGYKLVAPILGFFEIIIWLLAISQIMQHLDNWVCYVAYGGGFAAGNLIGITLEQKLSIGNVIIRVFPKKDVSELADDLRSQAFGVSAIEIQGKEGRKKMLFSVIQRKHIKQYIDTVLHHNPRAFYTVEDIKAVSDIYSKAPSSPKILNRNRVRKGK